MPSTFTWVTAAPASEESSTRRSALPSVRPKPRSSGSTWKRPKSSQVWRASTFATMGSDPYTGKVWASSRTDGDKAAAPRDREPQPIPHVLQPALQHSQQLEAGGPLAPVSSSVMLAELPLQHAVDVARLLLFLELVRILRELAPALPIIARRIVAPLD